MIKYQQANANVYSGVIEQLKGLEEFEVASTLSNICNAANIER